MRYKYDGYKNTFSKAETQGNVKRWFICLTIGCLILAGLCFGTVGRQAYSQHRAAQSVAARQLVASQAAAVQKRMTIFPKWEVKSKMANYTAAGAGSSDFNGTPYAPSGTFGGQTLYQLDASHQVWWDGTMWKMSPAAGDFAFNRPYQGGTNPADPSDGAWSVEAGPGPAPTFTLVASDTTAPVINTNTGCSITKTGGVYYLYVPFTEAGVVSGTTGWTLTGTLYGSATLGTPVITSNVAKFAINRLIYTDETSIKANYSPGNFTDDNANAMVAVSNVTVTTTSSDTIDIIPSTYASSNIPINGLSVNTVLTEAGSAPILPTSGVTGYTIKVNGVEYVIPAGTASGVTNNLPSPVQIYQTDVVYVKYDPGNVTDSATSPNAMLAFGYQLVGNGSTVPRVFFKPSIMVAGQFKNLPANEYLFGTGGADTQVQFNSGGVLSGDSGLTWSPLSQTLGLNGLNPTVDFNAITTEPTPPSTGILTVYSRSIAGRMLPKWVGPSGVDTAFQSSFFQNRILMYVPNTSSTGTGSGSGIGPVWTAGGTVNHPTPVSTAPAISNQMRRTRYANIVTTTNQTLGIKAAAVDTLNYWRGNAAGLGGFFFAARFIVELYPASTVRLFAGLAASSSVYVVASDTVINNTCGLWHDTTDPSSGSGAFSFVTRNATTTTKTPIVLANAIAAGRSYDFYMFCPPNGSLITYRLDDVVSGVTYEGSTSTNLPVNTAFMGPQCAMSNGTANVTVTTTAIGIAGVYTESDR